MWSSEFIKKIIVCVYIDIAQNIKLLLFLLVRKSHLLQVSQLWTKAKQENFTPTDSSFRISHYSALHWCPTLCL